jgi:hypothetical protein
MNCSQSQQQRMNAMTANRFSTLRPCAAGIALTALLLLAGCEGREPIEIPDAKIEPVTAYGLTLDENATPEQVSYVLTRAIADDVKAAQAHKHDEHKAAVDTQFKIAAYSVLEKRVLGAKNSRGGPEVSTLDPDRTEQIYEVVKQWGSIAAHYVPSFADTFDAAAARMDVEKESSTAATVTYKVSHAPDAATEDQRQPATLAFDLHKEKAGDKSYWRVAMVDFKRPPLPTTTQKRD